MAPERWTTGDDQLNFLKEKLPEYIEHSQNNTLHLFWNDIYAGWASKWPEIDVLIASGDLPDNAKAPSADDPTDGTAFVWTDVYTEVYQDALYLRKKRIREWMSNNRRKTLGLAAMESTTAASSLLVEATTKGGRGHQLREIFRRMYKDEVAAAQDAELKTFPNPNPVATKKKGKADRQPSPPPPPASIDSNAPLPMTNKAYSMKIRQAVLKRMWEEADEDVKAKVRAERDREKAERTLVPDVEGKKGLDREPEARQSSLNALGPRLARVLQEVYELCGWSTLLIGVGPTPDIGEKLSVKTFSYGHETAPSATFPNVYAGYTENFITPFVEWSKTIYPKHLRGGKRNAPESAPETPTTSRESLANTPSMSSPSPGGSAPMTFDEGEIEDEELGVDADDDHLRLPVTVPSITTDHHIPLPAPPLSVAPVTPRQARSVPDSAALATHDPDVESITLVSEIDADARPHDTHPGGPSEPISAAFDRMGLPPAKSTALSSPVSPPLNENAPPEIPIDPVLLTETPGNPPTQLGLPTESILGSINEIVQPHRPHMLNYGSVGLPGLRGGGSLATNSDKGNSTRGRGTDRGRGRGSGRGGRGGAHGRSVAHGAVAEAELASPAAMVQNAEGAQQEPEGPAHPDKNISCTGTDTHNDKTQVTQLSRSERARINKANQDLNSQGKGGPAKQGGRKAKPTLFNPDGPTPLVVLPPLDYPAQGLASQRPHRERRPPARFDNALPQKRSAPAAPAAPKNKRLRK